MTRQVGPIKLLFTALLLRQRRPPGTLVNTTSLISFPGTAWRSASLNGFFGKPPAWPVWDCHTGITATALTQMLAFCRLLFELLRMRQIHCSPQTVTQTSTMEPDSFPHLPL